MSNFSNDTMTAEFMNHTSTPSLVSRIVFGFVLSMLTTSGTVGNILVVLTIVTDRKMRRSPMNRLLANLAIADFGNLVCCVPDWLQQLVFGEGIWVHQLLIMCAPLRYLQVAFLYTSVLTQMVVCIERYIAIAHPLRVRILCSTKTSYSSLLITWVLGGVFASPYYAFHFGVPDGHCRMNVSPYLRPVFLAFKTTECICFYFVPMLLLSVLYCRIAALLWRPHTALLNAKHRPQPPTSNNNVDVDNNNRIQIDDDQEARRDSAGRFIVNKKSVDRYRTRVGTLQRFRRTPKSSSSSNAEPKCPSDRFVTGGRSSVATRKTVIKMLFVCILVYFVCYSPIQAIFISMSLFGRPLMAKRSPFEYEIVLFLNALATASSACNPIIYTFFYEKFRVRFIAILCCQKGFAGGASSMPGGGGADDMTVCQTYAGAGSPRTRGRTSPKRSTVAVPGGGRLLHHRFDVGKQKISTASGGRPISSGVRGAIGAPPGDSRRKMTAPGHLPVRARFNLTVTVSNTPPPPVGKTKPKKSVRLLATPDDDSTSNDAQNLAYIDEELTPGARRRRASGVEMVATTPAAGRRRGALTTSVTETALNLSAGADANSNWL